MTPDDTTQSGVWFVELNQVDIKTELWVAQVTKKYELLSTITQPFKNKMVEFSYKTLAESWWVTAIWFSGDGNLYQINLATKALSLLSTSFTTLGTYANTPTYSDIAFFQGRLFFPNSVNTLNSLRVWTSGQGTGVNSDGVSTTVSINHLLISWVSFDDIDKSLEGGILVARLAGTNYTRNIISVDNTAQTMELDSILPAWDYTAYAYNLSIWVVKNSSGTNIWIDTLRRQTSYRPMKEHNSKLFVWDGDMVYSLDSTCTLWKTTNWDQAISVGSDYVVKQIESDWNYLYILADNFQSHYINTAGSDFYVRSAKSKLYIWDWVSEWFSKIVDVGSHCFCIKEVDNVLYALLSPETNDGVLLTYFNGSDFPTVQRIRKQDASTDVLQKPLAFVNSLDYDRGKFYIALNGIENGVETQTLYVLSTYASEANGLYKEKEVSGTQIRWVDILRTGINPLILYYTSTGIYYRGTSMENTGYIITKIYDFTKYQYGELVKGVQLQFKETLPAGSLVRIYWKWDEESSFSSLFANITASNQNQILFGIMKRYRKLQLKVELQWVTAWSPKLTWIYIY